MKTAVQLDFDGTVTVHDISYLLLDAYAGDAWRQHLRDYEDGRINVGTFNRRVFGLVKAGREEMTDFVLGSERLVIREGFADFIGYCRQRGYHLVITSNGLRFYVEAILERLGIRGIEIHASENEFSPKGMKVKYIGPDGLETDDGFKAAYTLSLAGQGYTVVYAGDGKSDIYAARLARHVFATGDLLEKCREEGLACQEFRDFRDILSGAEKLELG
jgi:2-hydroxy-3-keto-5-methylthiopentenyl-1-phosphate phosphatase